MDSNDTFKYTYSSREQEEIKSIREKYSPREREEDKMTRLRRLDAGVTQKATAFAIVFGVVGALVMGGGMSLVMTELGKALGLGGGAAMIVGIAAGLAGIVLVSLAYPVYCRILKKEREKLAPEIIRLTDELMK